MLEKHQQLVNRAREYGSAEEFKANDLPGYLLCKKNRLLSIAFPMEKPMELKPGIYYLYKDLRVVYIGMSEVDAKRSMLSLIEEAFITVNNYKVFHPISKADIRVLYHYLVAKYKPKYNNDVVSDLLTIRIPEAVSLLGEPERGTL